MKRFLVQTPLLIATFVICSLAFQLHCLDLRSSFHRVYGVSCWSSIAPGRTRSRFQLEQSSKATTRGDFFADMKQLAGFSCSLIAAGISPGIAKANTDPEKQLYTIRDCDVSSSSDNNNCVSTASVKNLYLYTPPWTFECSPEEAYARLKGSIAADSSLTVVAKDEENKYIKIQTERNALGGPQDELEFLVRGGPDGVVTFRSARMYANGLSDFGAIRNRLETLRQKSKVFDVMGGGLTADSYDVPLKKNGFLGQLKAFYGLQSGEGFEDVFNDDNEE